jgi:hypothetical protein
MSFLKMKKTLTTLVKVKKIEKDLYRKSKGLANNVHVANKAGEVNSRNDDFIVQLLPFKKELLY